jgi:GTP-binding protein
MLDFLASLGVPTLFALTKIDKLTATQRRARIRALVDNLGVAEDQVIPFSAVTGEGRDELAEAVMSLVVQPAWRSEGAGRTH